MRQDGPGELTQPALRLQTLCHAAFAALAFALVLVLGMLLRSNAPMDAWAQNHASVANHDEQLRQVTPDPDPDPDPDPEPQRELQWTHMQVAIGHMPSAAAAPSCRGSLSLSVVTIQFQPF